MTFNPGRLHTFGKSLEIERFTNWHQVFTAWFAVETCTMFQLLLIVVTITGIFTVYNFYHVTIMATFKLNDSANRISIVDICHVDNFNIFIQVCIKSVIIKVFLKGFKRDKGAAVTFIHSVTY